MSRSVVVVGVIAALALPSAATAQNQLKWGPAPPVFQPGAKMAVVSGNPMAAGPYVVRLQMPANYRVAPHYHPTDEHVKVIRGTFQVGMGDTIKVAQMKRLNVGDTVTAPAQAHHYAMTGRGTTMVEVSGTGPFQLTYVNPKDMPKAAKTTAKK